MKVKKSDAQPKPPPLHTAVCLASVVSSSPLRTSCSSSAVAASSAGNEEFHKAPPSASVCVTFPMMTGSCFMAHVCLKPTRS
eukprot:CAMPEP_0180716148 /NCGR_PEP_ID=MMETSP1038_2-20121128/13308_1 /TAXON_ID=632150 /ORGANISM="Azadinium spinosum, Strain 3D9" /LENGTH=81 /DNA_ID=CAMNT_0022748575 /DNA_START=881 /DNA_END=1129 /DNA_ORIENTATION=-